MRIATGALRPRYDTVFYMGCGAGGRQAGSSALTHCLPIEFVGGGVPAAPLTGGLYSTPPGTAAQSRGVLFFSFAQWYLLVRQPFIPDQYTQHVSHIPAKQFGLAGLPQPLAHFLLQAVMQKIIATAIKSTANFLTFILFLLFLFLNSKMAIRINEYHCHKHGRFPQRRKPLAYFFIFHTMQCSAHEHHYSLLSDHRNGNKPLHLSVYHNQNRTRSY